MFWEIIVLNFLERYSGGYLTQSKNFKKRLNFEKTFKEESAMGEHNRLHGKKLVLKHSKKYKQQLNNYPRCLECNVLKTISNFVTKKLRYEHYPVLTDIKSVRRGDHINWERGLQLRTKIKKSACRELLSAIRVGSTSRFKMTGLQVLSRMSRTALWSWFWSPDERHIKQCSLKVSGKILQRDAQVETDQNALTVGCKSEKRWLDISMPDRGAGR